MKKVYADFAEFVEKQLNQLLSSPASCKVYTARGQVFKAQVNRKAPQITLFFKLLKSPHEQTILYNDQGKCFITFEDLEVANVFDSWLCSLEQTFVRNVEVIVHPPEPETIPEVNTLVQPVDSLDVLEVIEDEADSNFEAETSITEIDESFYDWAFANLRSLTEEKASFKKDIPVEFSYLATSKRTITDSRILTMLANRTPVME